MSDSLHVRLNDAALRIALPEPTSTDPAYNQRAWAPYFHSLAASGAVGVPIPLDAATGTIQRLVESCCGILLPGSPADVRPESYGAARVAETAAADAARERVDQILLEDAFRTGKPVFGICFGLQSLNVWRGGSLIQHLPEVTPVIHDAGAQVLSAHAVRITPGSRLAEVVGEAHDPASMTNRSATMVNSSHHQAVDNPGRDLTVSARCLEDGRIEALEGGEAAHFVIGVQWHPERTFDSSEASRHLFKGFVEAAARYRAHAPAPSLAV